MNAIVDQSNTKEHPMIDPTLAPRAGDRPQPPGVPSHCCPKLKQGILRLRHRLQDRYERLFPGRRDQIARALEKAEAMAWTTPFPALFFSALVHLQMAGIYPQMAVASAAGLIVNSFHAKKSYE
jgi:hypothetical protein